MKKVKLLTSLAAFVLVLSLGACDENTQDETTDKGSETTETEETEDTSESTESSETSESTETDDTTDTGGNEANEGNEGGIEGALSGTYRLGALYESEYCYKYFDGTAFTTTSGGSTNYFLNVTSDWDEAVDVTIEVDETAIETLDDEQELTGIPYTLSFTDGDGATKYISWSNSTQVDISDEPYTWYWVDSIECFAAGSTSGRVLVMYSGASFRAYAQNETNLAYPHVYPYTEAQENPEPPEVTTSYEQVSSLGEGGEFYAGGYSSSTLYLTTGSISGYNFPTSANLDSCVPFTVTGNATEGYTLTLSNGNYLYMYDTGSYRDFGTSNATTVPNNGTKVFFWNDANSTLYCSGSTISSSYNYCYFEFYNNNVCAYGSNSTTFSNAAHFYKQVTTVVQ